MKIIYPPGSLVVDISDWVDHLKTQEIEDGGVASVIVGLYRKTVNGKTVLSPKSRQHCEAVAKSNMVLQGYYYDDITQDPLKQADWLVDTVAMEGLPIKFLWADQEMWWSDWNKYYAARAGKIPYSAVPRPQTSDLARHNERFVERLYSRFSQSGVYTNKGFVSSWAPRMDAWLGKDSAWVPHYGKQPPKAIKMTWETLRTYWMPKYDIALSAGQDPAKVAGHQFTGDKCLLPGSYNQYDWVPGWPNGGCLPMDVSVFAQSFIDAIRGGAAPVPVPVPVPAPLPIPPAPVASGAPGAYKVTAALLNVFTGPGSAFKQSSASPLRKEAVVYVLEIITASGEQWAHIDKPSGCYVRATWLAKI
ncbi:MAG: hypothetical protein IMZ61_12210 [Planctomycetes bacterium]|nr:hypothetical protein [Planctomycetota bacterium]